MLFLTPIKYQYPIQYDNPSAYLWGFAIGRPTDNDYKAV